MTSGRPWPAVFVDRDGLLDRQPGAADPCLSAATISSLRRLQAAGFRLVIISNQPGVARGQLEESQVRNGLRQLNASLRAKGVNLDDLAYCPHHPDGTVERYRRSCMCRTPMPGLLLAAAERHGLTLEKSWVIGGLLDGIEAGNRAGCRSLLVAGAENDNGEEGGLRQPWQVVADLARATDSIIKHGSRQLQPLLSARPVRHRLA